MTINFISEKSNVLILDTSKKEMKRRGITEARRILTVHESGHKQHVLYVRERDLDMLERSHEKRGYAAV